MLAELLVLLSELFGLGAGLLGGLAVVGAGYGIGKIGGQAMDAIARQPEAQPKIQSSLIVAAALIEGAALFAIVVALILAIK